MHNHVSMRSHACGAIATEHINASVHLCGWVQGSRDHGGVIFIDLRDAGGIVQVVADPDNKALFAVAESLRGEYVLRVQGRVRKRPQGTENPALATGLVEVVAEDITVLSAAEALPFQLDESGVGIATRLKHRYLDLRTPVMQQRLRARHRIIKNIRAFLDERGFVDIETPLLTRSTPEGARDYLVPSRMHAGQFYALPQSPQLFKQLLMMAGFERYYQIARCFRDEDLRSDRQAEFTQLDIEMSFVNESDVQKLTTELMHTLFATELDVELPSDFPTMSYSEAMMRFGSDRPDVRIAMELTDITELCKGVEFKVFSSPANRGTGRVAALRVAGGEALSRQQIDAYTEFVARYGARGLAWIKIRDVTSAEGLQSPILKFLPKETVREILKKSGAKSGDIVFFGADDVRVVNDSLGQLRLQLGRDLGLVAPGWRPLWVVDFPLMEYDEESARWTAVHHPFTAPLADDVPKLQSAPREVRSRAYDLVLNGVELGGGSIRNHQRDMQRQVFAALGIGEAEADAKFRFLLDAMRYGAPPHGGIALGIDRLVAMMNGVDSIRDVIAFPKTQRAACLLTDAPSAVESTQLRDLGLRLRQKPGTDATPVSAASPAAATL